MRASAARDHSCGSGHWRTPALLSTNVAQVRLLRLSITVSLIMEAALMVHPMVAATNLFVGAGVLGKGIAYVHIADVIAQGIAYLITPTVMVLLLSAAWGVAHSARGIAALALQPIVLAGAVVPFLRPMLLVHPVVLLLVVVATVGLLILLIGHTDKTPARHRRWWILAAYAVAVAGLAGWSGSSTDMPYNPTAALAPTGSGNAATTKNLPRAKAPQNPNLAANPFNSIHNDAWATDAYTLPAPGDPQGAAVASLFTGGDCATVTFDSRGRLITLCSTLTRVVAYIVDPATLQVLDRQVVGQRAPSLTDFSGGGYFVLDDQDRIVFPARGGTLRILTTTDGIQETASIDVSATLQPDEQVTSVLPDWQGRYWYVGSLGTVGVVRDGTPDAINLGREDIENSFAVDRDGVYVITGAALYRLGAGDEGSPREVWRTEYDGGTTRKPGQTSRASGTTPTLFADWGVAFTDNAEPRMNVVVADRRSGQVVCEVPVFADNASATENSLIAVADSLIVENNYGYSPAVTATTAGRTTEPGMAAITAIDGECSPSWTNDGIHVPSLVSKATTKAGLILTYTKPADDRGVDAWYFTAVDARTGREVWTRRAGAGTPFNNHYAGAYLSPDGDLFVGTLNGLVVLRGG